MANTVNPLLQSVELARDKFNHSIQVLSPALGSTTVVSVSGASASGSLPTGTSIIRFASTANCHVVFGIGSAPTATTSDWLFPAGVEVFTVPSGATHFAVIGAGGNVTVSGKLAVSASDSIATNTILGNVTSSAKLAASKVIAIATTVSIAGGSGVTGVNNLAASAAKAIAGTIVFGSNTIQSVITSVKTIAIPTTVFIYDPSATPTIFQRMNFLRRFIGRR